MKDKPAYYLSNDSRCYYYSGTDYILAHELLSQPEEVRKRFHPFCCGFDCTDKYAAMQIDRQAALYFDRASIYLPDFQGAFSMTVNPVDGEPITIECPPDVNGFEYEIRESSRCVREGRSHSDIFKPEDSVAVLRLLDEVRESWNMRFAFED